MTTISKHSKLCAETQGAASHQLHRMAGAASAGGRGETATQRPSLTVGVRRSGQWRFAGAPDQSVAAPAAQHYEGT